MKSYNLLEKNKEIIIKRYNNGESGGNLRKEFRCSSETLKRFLIKNNCKFRDSILSHLKASFDKDYFSSISNHEKAYWLGFLYADGNIYKKRLQLCLAPKDKNHIITFQKHISSNHKLYDDRGNPRLIITSFRLVNDLYNLGCVSNKSLILKFPPKKYVPTKFINSFLLGYFDGDGCISVRTERKCRRWAASLLGTKEFLTPIVIFLSNFLNCKISFFKEKRSNNNVWVLIAGGGCQTEVGKYKLRKLYNYLYKNIDFSLERKRNIFLNALN